ncbi:MAG: hypothetical protein HQL06_03750 [Nitrospirae bacterium]|nr:hypothetical protein [Nitrospirota bacterium]
MRFPGKMLSNLGGIALVEYVYMRCAQSMKSDGVVVLTSNEDSDNILAEYCKSKEIKVFRGKINDVLDRYISCGIHYGYDTICRVCGDSPFVDVCKIDEMFEMAEKYDYVSFENTIAGFLSEVVSLSCLQRVSQLTSNLNDCEHVTLYIREHSHEFLAKIIDADLYDSSLEGINLTIDYPMDIELANQIIDKGLKGFRFSSANIVQILKQHINFHPYKRSKQ